MDDTFILYASTEHLNSMQLLAEFIGKHHPFTPIIILCSAADSACTAAATISTIPLVTDRRLTAALPPNLTDPVELCFETSRLNNPNLSDALLEISQTSRIKAFVMDFFCNSALEVSTSLDIPTYFYFSSGLFNLCVFLHLPTIDESIPVAIGDLHDFLEIPGCPPIHSSDFPKGIFSRQSNTYRHVMDTANNMRRSLGIIVNGFDALEIRAKEAISSGLCVPEAATPPFYAIGPLVDESNSKNGGADHECLKWLDEQTSKSVIFLCFGRRGLLSGEQLKEMAIGLENSGHRFLWSVRNPPGKQESPPEAASDEPDLGELLPEGFLERTEERGLVIKSWAPQKKVISHDAVAGFVTHCGWSSVLEAASCGMPMICWPLYAEQRMNGVFMVGEMKVALALEGTADGFVTAAELEKRLRELMDSKAGRAIRHRVAEMKNAAGAAVQENGSSLVALQNFYGIVGTGLVLKE